jgi:hypothetical protein
VEGEEEEPRPEEEGGEARSGEEEEEEPRPEEEEEEEEEEELRNEKIADLSARRERMRSLRELDEVREHSFPLQRPTTNKK